MEESAYIGSALSGLVYFALGARLVWLGIRTGSTPERLLGLSFLTWGLSYLFWIIPIALQTQPIVESQLLLVGRILNNIGNIVIATPVISSVPFARSIAIDQTCWVSNSMVWNAIIPVNTVQAMPVMPQSR